MQWILVMSMLIINGTTAEEFLRVDAQKLSEDLCRLGATPEGGHAYAQGVTLRYNHEGHPHHVQRIQATCIGVGPIQPPLVEPPDWTPREKVI